MQKVRGIPLLALLMAGTQGPAQTSTTGSISGSVSVGPARDPVAGARIRLVSAQITRTAVTDGGGRFMVGLLNSGEWIVFVDKPGFQSWNHGIPVAVNTETPVRIRLVEVAGATVAVSGAPAAAMDLTSVAGTTLFNDDSIGRLPLARNMSDLVLLAPTAAAGPATMGGEGLGYSINGASGAENQFLLDGLVTNDPRFGGQGTDLVTEFIETAEIQTRGFKPEYSSLGGVFSAVLKSGTNAFKGAAWATYLPGSLTTRPKGNLLAAETSPPSRYDLGFHAGGPLLKDRLFYFIGLDLDQYRIPADSGQVGMTPTFFGGRTIVNAQTTRNVQLVAKANWFLSPEQQFTASVFSTSRRLEVPYGGPTVFSEANYGAITRNDSSNLSLVYDQSLTPELFLSLKLGSAQFESRLQPEDAARANITDFHWFSPGGGGPDPGYAGQSYSRGGYGQYFSETSRSRQFRADLTWAPGRHEIKVGVARTDLRYWRQDWATGPGNVIWTISEDPSDANSLTAMSQELGQIGGAAVTARQHALYLQDTWEIVGGLRAFFGFRLETQEHFDRDGKRILAFTKLEDGLTPRLGFTWDPGRDGRSKLSGSFARYFELIPLRGDLTIYGRQKFHLSFYPVAVYDPRGLGTLGPRFFFWDNSTPFNGEPVADGLKLPRRTEFALGYERDLGKGLTFTTAAVSRKLENPIEDGLILRRGGLWSDGQAYANIYAGDLGYVARGIRWNPGPTVTWVAGPGEVDAQGNPIGGRRITVHDTLFKEAYNRYLALTLGLQQRLERGFWSAVYTWSHFYGTYQGVINFDYGGAAQAEPHATAWYDTWAYAGAGNLALDRRHHLKIHGYQRFTVAKRPLTVGVKWSWISGMPLSLMDDGSSAAGLPPGTLASQGDFSYDPGQYGSNTPDRFLFGNHGRAPSQSVVDLHLDMEFKLGNTLVRPVLDVFNLFNTRVATAIWQQATYAFVGTPNPNYGEAQSWIPGRRCQFGLRVAF